MAIERLKVSYTGTNVGKIYFRDVDRRQQLGGAAEGNYNGGQDQYIIWGESKVFELTGDVLHSVSHGVMKYFSTEASSTVFSNNGAPFTLEVGSYTSVDEVPRQDIGDTGSSRYTDAYMERLADAKWGTGAAGDTGYYYGNEDA